MNQMTDTAVENDLCAACGADVREEALFCYNCGGPLQAEEGGGEHEAASDVWMRGDISGEDLADDKASEDYQESIPMPEEGLDVDAAEPDEGSEAAEADEEADPDGSDSKPVNRVKRKRKSAASIRKKPEFVRGRKVEVVWEEKGDSPNIWFIVMSILVTVIAGILFYLAMMLK